MPKGARKTSIVSKSKMLGGKSAYYTSGASSKGKWAEDEGDVRVKVGDKGLAKIKVCPNGLHCNLLRQPPPNTSS